MFIRAYDSDPVVDDHLDNIFIEMDLAESSNFTTAQEFTGDMNRVIIRMTFRVMCQENYYGANCDRYCLAQNDSETGHYTCEADGSIRCLSGFENVNNSCRDGMLHFALNLQESHQQSMPKKQPTWREG